jgi:L-amino acid N-acyltransferase YncA
MDGQKLTPITGRNATHEDIPAIVEMSRKFYATTNYAALAPMDDDQVATIAAMLIDTGVMLLAERDGKVVGMIGLALMPFTFNPALTIAAEVVWWVDPEHQDCGIGRYLLDNAGHAAKRHGAHIVQMMALATSPPQAGKLYEHLGYAHSETSYTKRID